MTDQLLGTVSSGPVAGVDPNGALHPLDAKWEVSWWVASEERWHHPESEPSRRQRRVEELPIIETAIRVPSGDVVGTAFAYVGHHGRTEVSFGLRNESPVPVAVAFVVGPADAIEVEGREVRVGGEVALRLSRPVAVAVSAPSRAELCERVVDASAIETGPMSGYVAVVVPLPHAQACDGLVLPGESPPEAPSVERLTAGWATHLERGATFALPDPLAARARGALAEVALGPADHGELRVVADHLRAVLHLGWFDEAADPTERLLRAQRGRGAIGDEATTIAAISALSSWRLAAVPAATMEGVVMAVAAASRWIARRLRHLDDPTRLAARDALIESGRFLVAAGQPQAAIPVATLDASSSRANDGRSPGDEAESPAARTAARTVVEVIEGLVVDTDEGVELLSGWTSAWWGAPVEATSVPTRWGRVSFAVRWHGERPALLWEVVPWDPQHEATPLLRAPVLDPAWSSSRPSGDALLAPRSDRPTDAPRVEVDHGSGFAVWDPPSPTRPDVADAPPGPAAGESFS